MDNVTHTLAGVALANAFFRKRVGPEAVPILAAASNITDIDAAVLLTHHPYAVTMRRTFGHSVLLLPVWALALTLLFRSIYPKTPSRAVFGLCALGIAVHLFMDLINSFGVVLLWPLSDLRPELALVFIIDLILAGILAAPLLSLLIPRLRPNLERISRFSIAAAALYIAFCGFNRFLAYRALEKSMASQGEKTWTYVFPEALGPHRWRGAVRSAGVYHLYLIHSLTGVVEPRGEVRTQTDDPAVDKVRGTPEARRLEWFFKAPVWEAEPARPQGTRVTVYDLRFTSLVLRQPGHFRYRFLVPPSGPIEAL